jgi:hypothetical protein
MDRMEYFKQQDRNKQNQANREFLQAQIAEKQMRKTNERDYELLYYKPHFGPEETLDQVKVNLDAQ